MRKNYLFCFIFLLAFSTFSPGFAIKKQLEGKNDLQTEERKVVGRDIHFRLPTPQISLILGEKISAQKKIEIKFSDISEIEIEKVEVYLRQPPSLTEIYVGQPERKDGIFEFDFDPKGFPNGQYFIFLKIFSSLGEYKSQEILIEIDNRVEEKKEEIANLKKEVGSVIQNLEEKEEKTEEIIKRVSSQIEETVSEKVPEIKKEMGNVVKKEVEPKIKEMKSKVEKEIIAKEKGADTLKAQKEKEILKREIVEKTIEPIEKKIVPLSPLEKERVELKKQEAAKKVEEILEKAEIQLKEVAKEKKDIHPKAFQDSDNDELSDWQELIIGTNPFNPDTDSDGYLDGIEYRLGFDSKKAGPADKILWQDPREKGKVGERVVVESVEIVDGKLKIIGRGIPNSFVTIYIFSKPIVALAKVNENGFFEYVLDKKLPDGAHTVYVALTNNKGEIEEKSSAFTFVQSQGKILRITEFLSPEDASPPSKVLERNFLILVLALIVFSLGIGFFIMGLVIQRKRI